MTRYHKPIIEPTRLRRLACACGAALVVGWLGAGVALAQNFGPWEAPVSVDPGRLTVNGHVNDGCPIEAPDGLTLFFASNRTDATKTTTDLDIWVAYRDSEDAPWSEVARLPTPVNSGYDEFCPTPLPGNRLLFVSRKPSACGGVNQGDIYYTQHHPVKGWLPPVSLGCAVNSAFEEFSPSLVEAEGRTLLYFSSSRGDGVNQQIYVSELDKSGEWGVPYLVTELSVPSASVARPNVRKDGLEIVYDVAAPGGTPQIYTASRSSVFEPWQDVQPVSAVNIANKQQTRASISRDGTRLYFGSTRANVAGDSGTDIFVSTRSGPGKK
jgi:hypothetical protein